MPTQHPPPRQRLTIVSPRSTIVADGPAAIVATVALRFIKLAGLALAGWMGMDIGPDALALFDHVGTPAPWGGPADPTP